MTSKLPWLMRMVVAFTRWKLKGQIVKCIPAEMGQGFEMVHWAGTIHDVKVRYTVPMQIEAFATGSAAGERSVTRVAVDAAQLRWHPLRKAWVARDWRNA